jgi:hypothetical protein
MMKGWAVKCKNKEEFLNVIKLNFPEIYNYICNLRDNIKADKLKKGVYVSPDITDTITQELHMEVDRESHESL